MSTQDETMVDEPEEESGEASNRMFMILAGGLAALFVVGLICIAAVFFMQRNQAASTQAANATQAAKNATVVAGATLAAQPTATLAPTELPPVPTATEVPPTSAPTVEVSPTTPAPTVTTTAVKVTPTATLTGKPSAGTPASVASAASPTPTSESGTTPQTGMGGFGIVLAATVLLVVLFVARRLRLSQP